MWAGLLAALGAGMLVFETVWGEGRWPIVLAGLALCTQTARDLVRIVSRNGNGAGR